MRCPRCETENPEDAQFCTSCSFILTAPPIEQPPPKKKTSKLAIGSALLAGLSALLLVFVDPTLAFLVALMGISVAITSIIKIRKSKGTLVGKSFAIASVIFVSLYLIALSFWRIDAPPIPNDYTISDIRSAPPQYNQSYELLNSLADEDSNLSGTQAIGLSTKDVNNLRQIIEVFREADYAKISNGLKANEDTIMRIWKNAEKGRNVITNLNTFPQIADLSEPSLEFKIPWLDNFRQLVHINRAYICLQSCRGNDEIAVKELLMLDDFFRKLNLNARTLLVKLSCMPCFAVNIQTANFIINDPNTSQHSVELLAQHFTPLTNEDIYLRNSIIFEYLTFKNELRKISKMRSVKYSSFSPFKLNSSYRAYRNFCCDNWIAAEENRRDFEKLSVWPSIYPKLPLIMDPNGNFTWYYKAYNPTGSMLFEMLEPAMERISQIKMKVLIHSDLLQIVLNKRLGKEINLKARAYGDEYIIDLENNKIFSSELDGKPHTKDDIKLIINPEVLDFSN